jgi:hypothetical protein
MSALLSALDRRLERMFALLAMGTLRRRRDTDPGAARDA